jgi:flagellar biosynthesis/type III secretory pathway M-ring protein FliF/YscJ
VAASFLLQQPKRRHSERSEESLYLPLEAKQISAFAVAVVLALAVAVAFAFVFLAVILRRRRRPASALVFASPNGFQPKNHLTQ